jgi:hypothetical protein
MTYERQRQFVQRPCEPRLVTKLHFLHRFTALSRASRARQVYPYWSYHAARSCACDAGRLVCYPLPEALHRVTGDSAAMAKPNGIE